MFYLDGFVITAVTVYYNKVYNIITTVNRLGFSSIPSPEPWYIIYKAIDISFEKIAEDYIHIS